MGAISMRAEQGTIYHNIRTKRTIEFNKGRQLDEAKMSANMKAMCGWMDIISRGVFTRPGWQIQRQRSNLANAIIRTTIKYTSTATSNEGTATRRCAGLPK